MDYIRQDAIHHISFENGFYFKKSQDSIAS